MLQVVGSAVTASAFFTNGGQGATSLTVTVDVYDQGNSLVVNGAATTEVGAGFYEYELAAAEFDTRGNYKFIFKTTGTADRQHVAAMWIAYGTLDLTETTSGTGLPLTLSGLRRMLRLRLNDILPTGNTAGNYRTEGLDYCINIAYRETLGKAKCHKATKSQAMTVGLHTYDCAEIFEPVEVSIGSTPLNPTSIGAVGVSMRDWNEAENGTPTDWLQLSGGNIRIHPPPDSTSNLIVHGYAYSVALTTDNQEPVGIQDGYAVQALLDRAESEARRMRPTAANNVVLSEQLYIRWADWCAAIRASSEAKG